MRSSKFYGSPSQALCALLALSLVLAPAFGPTADAKGKKEGKASVKEAPWPVRDFLPPVASINSKLDPAEQASKQADADPEEVSFVMEGQAQKLGKTPNINRSPKVLNGELSVMRSDAKTLAQLQTRVDEADLNRLWEATVERNPVIRFSLEKLATPADLGPKQSSIFMRKTLSTLISGAMMAGSYLAPTGGSYGQMGMMGAGNALQNMVEGRTQPTPNALSPTEQIQLAGLVDELKVKLIHGYQEYRTTLQSLADSHATTMKNNNMYSQALTSKNDLAIMAAGTAYYQALNTETALRQKAKLARLQLERLAGPVAVDDLQLAVDISPENAPTAAVNNAPASPELAPEPVTPQTPAQPDPPEVPTSLVKAPAPPATRQAAVENNEPIAMPALAPVPAGMSDALELGPEMEEATTRTAAPTTSTASAPIPTAPGGKGKKNKKAKPVVTAPAGSALNPLDPAIAGGRPDDAQ